ncbi:NAD-dependent epimerase/dehydratase family protein [Cellulosimicrobium cellulans]|uniref:NAD-dependent epimerase/dehydratase family protein n=1 Tax=Cellulosimicrobium cellulans TaxID=1710 RepID=UPI002097E9CF|nr:NAD(P)-dependent oxidoreductase [Cellulosimicrobium cellulans]MCO7272222.1 NAD(P)-dependent oxidoreductase [Cellulosimicrobium cellulans]
MHYLITGANGFVMSVLAVRILDAEPDAQVTGIDLHDPDQAALDNLGPLAQRAHFRAVDVTDGDAVAQAVREASPDAIVHGATVTHDARSEVENPARFTGVNVEGTVNLLDAARRLPQAPRVVLVSSGAVYGSSPETLLTEESAPRPDELYGISKWASELVARRFAELHALPTTITRLTKMFGPMERPTGGRAVMSLPFHLAAAAVRGEPARLTARTLEACGDWLSADSATDALHKAARHGGDPGTTRTLNISSGRRTSVRELVAAFGVDVVETPLDVAEADMDPRDDHGKNGVYVSERAQSELGWSPGDLQTQVAHYLEWARVHAHLLQPAGGPS